MSGDVHVFTYNTTMATVLVVEDNETFRKLLTDALSDAGFTVHEAPDGKIGVEKALQVHPDVVLLDVRLPEKTGTDVLADIRADEWGKTAKIFMLTEVQSMDTIAAAVKGGIAGYIVKNEQTLDEIVSQVKNATGSPA